MSYVEPKAVKEADVLAGRVKAVQVPCLCSSCGKRHYPTINALDAARREARAELLERLGNHPEGMDVAYVEASREFWP